MTFNLNIDFMTRIADPSRRVFTAMTMLAVLSGAGGLVAQNPSEQALRARVREFYALQQRGEWEQAENYVTPESRESFRNETKKSFLSFNIENIKLHPDGAGASVVVQVTTIVPFSPTPVPMPRATEWRFVDGTWLVLAGPAAASDESNPQAIRDPFNFGGAEPRQAPVPGKLAFKGHSYRLGRMQIGEVKEARFPFTNTTSEVVKIEEVLTGCECLRVKTQKMEYQPGEPGELVIEFDSKGYKDRYVQTIVVRTSPGDGTTNLRIEALLPARFAKPEAAPAR